MPTRRIGILTGGGDVPGLNSVIKHAVCRSADQGIEVTDVRRGWDGLKAQAVLLPRVPSPQESPLRRLDPHCVSANRTRSLPLLKCAVYARSGARGVENPCSCPALVRGLANLNY
jgi:hypothetical protein